MSKEVASSKSNGFLLNIYYDKDNKFSYEVVRIEADDNDCVDDADNNYDTIEDAMTDAQRYVDNCGLTNLGKNVTPKGRIC